MAVGAMANTILEHNHDGSNNNSQSEKKGNDYCQTIMGHSNLPYAQNAPKWYCQNAPTATYIISWNQPRLIGTSIDRGVGRIV